jgi:hypothetical protein
VFTGIASQIVDSLRPPTLSDHVARCVCGGNSEVTDTRPTCDDLFIRRRRGCLTCGERWTTYEVRFNENGRRTPTVLSHLRALQGAKGDSP